MLHHTISWHDDAMDINDKVVTYATSGTPSAGSDPSMERSHTKIGTTLGKVMLLNVVDRVYFL